MDTPRPDDGDPSQSRLNLNYQTSDGVRHRFEPYTLASEPVDLDKKVVSSLGLTNSNKDIVDIGTSDADLLYRLRWDI